jgi:hypothetical protein
MRKAKVLADISDGKWLWDLALLCDISHHINYLNTKLQDQKKLFLLYLGLSELLK